MNVSQKAGDTGNQKAGENGNQQSISPPVEWSGIIGGANKQRTQRKSNHFAQYSKMMENQTGNNRAKR